MPIIRQPQKFTMIPHELVDDETLSVGARFLLIYMISRPKDWTYNEDELKLRMNCGRQKLQKMMAELRTHGYLKYERVRKNGGRIIGTIRTFASTPEFIGPQPGFQ